MARPTIFYTDGFDDYGAVEDISTPGAWPGSALSGFSLVTGRKSYKNAIRGTITGNGLVRPIEATPDLAAGCSFQRIDAATMNLLSFLIAETNGTAGGRGAGLRGVEMFVTSAGQIVVTQAGGGHPSAALGVSAESVGTNEYNYVEMAVWGGGTASGTVKVWLNGKLVIDLSSVAVGGTGGLGGGFRYVRVRGGGTGAGGSGSMDQDDLYIGLPDATPATATPFGDARVYSFAPTDAVDVVDWTNEGGAADIPDALADTDDDTYAETDDVGVDLLVETDNTFDVTPREIHAVTLVARARKTDIGVVSVKPKLGTTSGAVTPDDPEFLGESFAGYQWTFAENPETSAPWDPTDFADFVFGIHVVDPEA